MAEHPHHNDPIEENVDSHPVKVAIGAASSAISSGDAINAAKARTSGSVS